MSTTAKIRLAGGQQHPAAPPVLNFVFIIEGRGPIPSSSRLLQYGLCLGTDSMVPSFLATMADWASSAVWRTSSYQSRSKCVKRKRRRKNQARQRRSPGHQVPSPRQAEKTQPSQPPTGKELYRQTDRSVNYLANRWSGEVQNPQKSHPATKSRQRMIRPFKSFLGSLMAAGKGVNGHGGNLSQKDRCGVA